LSYQINTPIQEYIEDCGCLEQEKFLKRNTLITGCAAYRRQILIDIGGFDIYLNACEDLDISIKTQLLGYSLNYVPEAIIYHDHPATVKGLFWQQYRNGIGFVRLHRKYGQKYSLGYNTSIFCFSMVKQLLFYPITLISALITKKNKYFVLKPLFNIIRTSGFTLGIIRETKLGKAYEGVPIQSRVDFYEFLDDKSILSLWEKIHKKYFNNDKNKKTV
jgi:cellulose synthase/poly-beta-1,6-N-acetylglucosamine synthase-like glycosyltransferase